MLKGEALPLNLCRARTASEQNGDVQAAADRFRERFDGNGASVEARQADTMAMVNEYYDLVTDFYEYGWGQAFHFAPRYQGEGFLESLCRHEYLLASKGGFGPGKRVLDIGCGVGGPMRNIARFTQANVVGINNNAYQISRGTRHNAKAGLSHLCSFIKTNFMEMPIKNDEYDGAYAIEATCHAANKTQCFSEVFRVLKPGSCFVGYEWIMTNKYDKSSAEQRAIKHGIELGDSLPDLETAEQVVAALKAAGFIVEEAYDLAEHFETSPAKTIPWYQPLTGNYWSLNGLKSTPLGRWTTMKMVGWLEFFRLAPKGSQSTAMILEEAAVNLVKGGELGIFTPCFFFKARKPTA
jgi:sterol 24-C-methyltransferase